LQLAVAVSKTCLVLFGVLDC